MNHDSSFYVYKFKVFLFGATCSQFLLIPGHQQIINKLKGELCIDNLQGTGDHIHEVIEQNNITLKSFSQAHLYRRSGSLIVNNCKM